MGKKKKGGKEETGKGGKKIGNSMVSGYARAKKNSHLGHKRRVSTEG